MKPAGLLWVAAWVGLGACGGAARMARVPAVPSDPAKAVARARAEIAERGPSAERYAELAAAQVASGEQAAALASTKRAMALDGDLAGPSVVAARLRAAAGDFESAALQYAEVALRWPGAMGAIADDWGAALLSMASGRVESGRPHAALAVLQELSARLPEVARRSRERRAKVALEVAERLVEARDGAAALDAVVMARAAGAPADATRFSEARARILGGDAQAGLALLGQWVDDGGAGEARAVSAARFLTRHGAADDALAAWERVATRDREGFEATAQMATAAGRAAQAVEAYRSAAALAPAGRSRAELLLRGALALGDRGDRDQSLALHAAAAAEAPGAWRYAESWLQSLARFGARPDMARVFAAALEASGDPLATAAEGAALLARAGAMDEAITALDAASRRAGAPAGLRLELAEALHRKKKLVARRNEVLEGYVAAAGDDAEALVAAGRAWWRYGEDRRALALGRRAQRLSPKSAGPALLIADAERAAGHVSDEQAALAVAAASSDPTAAALAIGERWLGLADPAQALPWLTRAAGADDRLVRRAAERALAKAYQRSRPPDDAEAGVYLARWLQSATADEREAALEEVLAATLNIPRLQELRLEALTASAALRPEDAVLADEAALLYLARRRPGRAMAIWRAHLADAPDSRAAAARIGALLVDKGFEDEGLEILDTVDAGAIDQPKLHRLLGGIYSRRGDEDRASAHYRLFLDAATRPEHVRELRLFAAEMEKLRRDELAELAYGRLVAQSPQDRDALRGLGTATLRLGRVAEARVQLDGYVRETPPTQRRRAREVLGELYESAGELRLAAQSYEDSRGEGATTSSHSATGRLMRIYQRLDDKEGIRRAVRASVDGARNPARQYQDAVNLLTEAGMLDDAAALLDEALVAQPSNRQLMKTAVQVALRQGNPAVARERLERMIRLRGATAEAWGEAATQLSQGGYVREGLALLNGDGVPVAAAPEIHEARGRLQVSLGEYDGAEQSFATALAQTQSPRELIAGVDAAWRGARQTERLRRFHVRAAALSPNRPDHALALGRLWLETGDLREAQQNFARYLGLQERGQVAVARAYAETGYADAAVQHYLKAFEQQQAGVEDWPLGDAAHFLIEQGRAELLPDLARLEVSRSRTPAQTVSAVVRALFEGGALDAAQELLERAMTVAPAPDHEVIRGALLLIDGRDEEAERAFERSVDRAQEIQSTMLRVHGVDRARIGMVALADVLHALLSRGRVDVALRQARRAAAIYGDDPRLAATEAEILVGLGRVDEALTRIRAVGERLGEAPVELVEALVARLERRERLGAAVEVAGLATRRRWNDALGERHLRLLIRLGDLAGAERVASRWAAQASPAAAVDIAGIALEEGYLSLAGRYGARAAAPPATARTADAVAVLDAVRAEAGGQVERDARGLVTEGAADRFQLWSTRARLAFRAGDLTRAREAVAAALSSFPGDAEMLRLRLRLAALAADAPAVEAMVREAGRGEHARQIALDEQVRQLDDAGRPELAMIPARALTEIEPGKPARHLRLVVLALRAGMDDEARAQGERMLAICGREPALVLALAELWAQWLRADEARRVLGGLDALAGESASRRERILAEAALADGDSAAALAAWERSVELSPDRISARLAGAESLLRWDVEAAGALSLLGPVLAGETPPPRALSTAARAAWRAGQGEQARGYTQKLVSLYPALGSDLPGLVEAAIRAGDPEGARLAAAAAVRRVGVASSVSLVARSAVAGLESLAGPHATSAAGAQRPPTFERSATVAESMLADAADAGALSAGDVATQLALVDEARGRPDLALAAYGAALAAQPQSPVALNNLAYAIGRLGGDLHRALAMVRKASRRIGEPTASLVDTEAWLLHRLGRSREALGHMRRALSLYATSAAGGEGSLEVLYHLGSIEAAAGGRAAAMAIWRDCGRREPTSRYGALCLERWREAAAR
jgi:predicted Zn-dependent protease